MNEKKLEAARKKIDNVDARIFDLIKKRTRIVKLMLTLKQHKSQIIDKKRIKKILKKMREKSIKNRMDPRITHRIWKEMIWSYVEFQRKNFKKK